MLKYNMEKFIWNWNIWETNIPVTNVSLCIYRSSVFVEALKEPLPKKIIGVHISILFLFAFVITVMPCVHKRHLCWITVCHSSSSHSLHPLTFLTMFNIQIRKERFNCKAQGIKSDKKNYLQNTAAWYKRRNTTIQFVIGSHNTGSLQSCKICNIHTLTMQCYTLKAGICLDFSFPLFILPVSLHIYCKKLLQFSSSLSLHLP
jgi:desulfoferrodoxin (superoxide reductase-like protein)